MNTTPPPVPNSLGAISPADQERTTPKGWKPTVSEPIPVVQCTGTRNDGERCTRWSIRGATVCLWHGGNLPNVKKAADDRVKAAKLRIIDSVDDAFETLHELLAPGTGEGIRLKAATELLDRAGLKPGMELTVTVEDNRSPLDSLMAELDKMSERLEDQGEIIDEPTAPEDMETSHPSEPEHHGHGLDRPLPEEQL